MKLCFLAPEFLPIVGGVGSYTVELVKNLCKYDDLEIHVITPKRGKNYDTKKILKFFDDGITLHNIGKANDTFFYNLEFQLSILKNFKNLNKKEKFDLVHAMNLVHMPDIFLKFIKISPSVKSLVTIHSTIDSQNNFNGNGNENVKLKITNKSFSEIFSSLFYFYIKFMQIQYLERTNNFIAVSEWIKNNVFNGINGTNGTKNGNIKVIHNGVDTKRFSPEMNEDFSEIDSIDKKKILYTGRLLAMKGLHTLIEAIKIVLKETRDVHFIFAGDGRKNWVNLMKKIIPKENYSFLGYVEYEKINKLYNKADMFVLPSLTESCPITLLEAMASGLPTISSNVGGIPEIIENNETGLLVPPKNSKELAEKILFLINNRKLARKLSFNGRKLVEKKFDSKIMAEKTKKFYEEILEN